MRDHTAETFFMIAGTVVGGLIGLGVIDGGIPALVFAAIGFGAACYYFGGRNDP